MFQTKFVERIKTHISYSVTFFSEVVSFLNSVEKHGTARQPTDDNMAHAHYMLDT